MSPSHLMNHVQTKRSLSHYYGGRAYELDSGFYSMVLSIPGNRVLKMARHKADELVDGAWEYLAAVYMRDQRLAWMPKIYDLGVSSNGTLWCVMDAYEESDSKAALATTDGLPPYEGSLPFLMGQAQHQSMTRWFVSVFDRTPSDLHTGNFMFDTRSGQWIITDPFGAHTPAKGLRRYFKTAQWKRESRFVH